MSIANHQLTFSDLNTPHARGGWRPNSGRPRSRNSATTPSHDERNRFPARFPALVTWRLVSGLRSLRRDHIAALIRDAISKSHKPWFRTVEFSIQTNHLHFLNEASGKVTLARGLQGLAKRLTLRLNAALDRTGQVFASRYHIRTLTTPREVKNAVRYVLLNARHHLDPALSIDPYWVDPYSSGPWFDGWASRISPRSTAGLLAKQPRPTQPAITWLLRVGWKRWGLLAFDERPGPATKTKAKK